MGSGTMESTSSYGLTLENITCETFLGVCHGEGSGTSNKGDENFTTFWKGEVMRFTDMQNGQHLRTLYVRGGERHGPSTYVYNNNEDQVVNYMTTDGFVTTGGGGYHEEAFFEGQGVPNWHALYNWCDYTTIYPVYSFSEHNHVFTGRSQLGTHCTYDPDVDSLTKAK